MESSQLKNIFNIKYVKKCGDDIQYGTAGFRAKYVIILSYQVNELTY